MALTRYLDNPVLWEASRHSFEFVLGLYKKRNALMSEWGLLTTQPTVLDVGCGTGHYSHITEGEYLGIDMNESYICHARRRHPGGRRSFLAMSVDEVSRLDRSFDLVLMVDILHHLDDAQCNSLLATIAGMAPRHLLSFEPVLDQTNPVGKWMVASDRGRHMRSSEGVRGLLLAAGFEVCRSRAMNHGMVYRTVGYQCAPGQGVRR